MDKCLKRLYCEALSKKHVRLRQNNYKKHIGICIDINGTTEFVIMFKISKE